MNVVRKSLAAALVLVLSVLATMADVRISHISQGWVEVLAVVSAVLGLICLYFAYSDRKRQLKWGFWGFFTVFCLGVVIGLVLSLKFH